MKRGYADTPQGQIHYYTEGTGEPLLLLHQTGSSRNLLKMVAPLAKEYRVFAIDNLGEGSSDSLPPNVEISDLARSYVHFMDALELDKAHVFGIHTGNKVGTELGAAWPSRVDGLILCGQTHSIQASHKDQVAVMGAKDRPMVRNFEPTPDGSHLLKQWATEFNLLSAMWWGTNVADTEALTPDLMQIRRDYVLDLLQTRGTVEKYRAIFAFDLATRMRDIKASATLVIEVRVPEEAHLTPQGPKLIKLIPNSRLATLKHAGPRKVTDAKAHELAAIIIGFLREGRAARRA